MIAAAILLAATPLPAPVIPLAAARSAAYRDCIASERKGRSGAEAGAIGRGTCARERSKLAGQVYKNLSHGWAATAKTSGQARRLRAQLKARTEAEVAGFEAKVRAWLAAAGAAHARQSGASAR
ncbi:MAG TPA: hypothetical protein VGB04_09670 [Allosphingosinicella sp.]|jgi:hypothetical protein